MAGQTTEIKGPTERRKFSIAELKRICAFPDDFILTGTYAAMGAARQLGSTADDEGHRRGGSRPDSYHCKQWSEQWREELRI